MRPRPSPPSPAGVTLSALALAAVSLPACSASPPPPPATANDLIEWAVGPEHLNPIPESSGNFLLALGPGAAGDAAAPPQPKCNQVTTILPAPGSDPRVFGLIAGKLHAFATRNADPAPLTGANPTLTLTRLLAFAKTNPPLTLLVAARPAGAQTEQLWTLTLNGNAITASAELTDKRVFASQETFFGQYDAPRCKPGGKDCVILSSDGTSSFLDVQSTRGAPPKTLQKLPKIAIDASWASADGNQIYLLVPCPPKTP